MARVWMHWRLRMLLRGEVLDLAACSWTLNRLRNFARKGWHWPQSPQWLVLVPMKMEPEGSKMNLIWSWFWRLTSTNQWFFRRNAWSNNAKNSSLKNRNLLILRYSEAWSILIIWPRGPSPLNQTYGCSAAKCCEFQTLPILRTLQTSLTSHSQVFSKIDPFILLFSPLFFLFFFLLLSFCSRPEASAHVRVRIEARTWILRA